MPGDVDTRPDCGACHGTGEGYGGGRCLECRGRGWRHSQAEEESRQAAEEQRADERREESWWQKNDERRDRFRRELDE